MKGRFINLFVLIVALALMVSAVGVQAKEPAVPLPSFNSGRGEEIMAAQPPAHNVALVGQMGGVVYGVAAQGHYVYAGIGPSLVIFDVTDPAQPAMVGQSSVLPDIVYDVTIAGNYAYVADGSSGLYIIDVTDRTHPNVIGSYNTAGNAHQVAWREPTLTWRIDPLGCASLTFPIRRILQRLSIFQDMLRVSRWRRTTPT